MTRIAGVVGIGGVAALAGIASAGVTVTVGTSAPAYTDRTLTFDEPGTPTGVVSQNTWVVSHGIVINAGDSVPAVNNHTAIYGPWAGTGNSFFGNFGIFMELATDATSLSLQAWDPSGNPTPFGGGARVIVFNDGVEVANQGFSPAWGGVGNSWINITAGPGESFDDVRILGFGFGPTTIGDNLSWDVVPAPSAATLLAVGGLVGSRRRRN